MANPWEFLPVDRPSGLGADAYAPLPKATAMSSPAETFRRELLAGGLPSHVVDGIMMNGHDESGFNPAAVGDNGNALGILQWNGPRKRALEDFAASMGASPTDPLIQAKFTLYELNGSERAAYARMLATKTPGEAGAAFVNFYERPAEEHRARREASYLGGSTAWQGAMGGAAGQGNALAAPNSPTAPQNALAEAPKAPQLAFQQQDVNSFMRQPSNALAMMQPLTYQRRGNLG